MWTRKTKLVVLAIVVVGLITPAVFLSSLPRLVVLFERISHVRFWGPIMLGAICLVASVLPLPTVVSILANGFLLGVRLGSIVSVISTTVGACAAFLIARCVARRWIAGKVDLGWRLAALDRAVGEQGFKIVLLSRLSPIAPFISLNYAFGLTQVSLAHYAWGTLIGGAPGTILYVSLGADLRSLEDLITWAGSGTRTARAHPLFLWVSLAVTAVVTVWLICVARAALRKAMPKEPVREEETVVPRDRW